MHRGASGQHPFDYPSRANSLTKPPIIAPLMAGKKKFVNEKRRQNALALRVDPSGTISVFLFVFFF